MREGGKGLALTLSYLVTWALAAAVLLAAREGTDEP